MYFITLQAINLTYDIAKRIMSVYYKLTLSFILLDVLFLQRINIITQTPSFRFVKKILPMGLLQYLTGIWGNFYLLPT